MSRREVDSEAADLAAGSGPMDAGQIRVKVYYEDTDSLGVVYYANYLKYLERGRTELIDRTGRTVADWNRDGVLFAVFKANLTFVAPGRLGEVLDVVSRVVRSGEYRMVLDQRILRDGQTLVEAEIHLVCIDRQLELRELPSGLLGHAGAAGDVAAGGSMP